MSLIEMSNLTEGQRERHRKAFAEYNLAYKEYTIAYRKANNYYWPNYSEAEKRKTIRDLTKYLRKFERARDKYFALCDRYGITRGQLKNYYC